MTARTCTGCDRPMRSRRDPDDGRVIHQARGKCSSCYNADNPHFRVGANRRTARGLSDEEREARRAANLAKATERRRARLASLAAPAPVEPGWEDRAACLTVGPHVFEDPDHAPAAKAICAGCPVARSCLEAAMREEAGEPTANRATVRGGLGPGERRSLDRLRRKEVA